jgi:integrase
MNIAKREGSPFWWVSFTDGNGRRHRVSTRETEKRAATKRAAEIVAEAENTAPKGDIWSLQACLESYRSNLEMLGKTWHKRSAHYANKTCGKLASSGRRWNLDPDMPIHELTPQHLQNLVEARTREKNGAVSIAHEIKNIRAAVRHSKALGRRVPEITSWRIPKLPQKTRYLTDAEWQLVYDRLSPHRTFTTPMPNGKTYERDPSPVEQATMQAAQDLFVALTFCGGRWSEVASLSWDRIDFDANVIRIWGNKTQRERFAPLPTMLKDVLLRMHKVRDPAQPLVFPGRPREKGKLGGVRGGTSRAILKAINACGLNTPQNIAQSGKATVHSLRHTFASWLLQKGAGLADVQDALGHTTMQMTRRYAHLSKVESTAKLTSILSDV